MTLWRLLIILKSRLSQFGATNSIRIGKTIGVMYGTQFVLFCLNKKEEKEMKYIQDKAFLRDIAHQLDLFNTIGGGVSKTYVDIKKKKKSAVISFWAAGVTPESFKIVLHNNQLTVFSVLQSQENPQLFAPLFNRTFLLPPQVDLSNIEAIFHGGSLKIKLPYYDSTNRPKEIQIKQL